MDQKVGIIVLSSLLWISFVEIIHNLNNFLCFTLQCHSFSMRVVPSIQDLVQFACRMDFSSPSVASAMVLANGRTIFLVHFHLFQCPTDRMHQMQHRWWLTMVVVLKCFSFLLPLFVIQSCNQTHHNEIIIFHVVQNCILWKVSTGHTYLALLLLFL